MCDTGNMQINKTFDTLAAWKSRQNANGADRMSVQARPDCISAQNGKAVKIRN